MDPVTLGMAKADAKKYAPITNTKVYGSAASLGSTAALSSTQWAYTTPWHNVISSGNITSISVPLSVAGTVVFSIGSLGPGNRWVNRKTLSAFTGVVGANTFTLNEPIYAGEILALNGGTASAQFGSVGGASFHQASASGAGNFSVGLAYAYSFTVVSNITADPALRASYKVYGTSAVGASADNPGNASTFKFSNSHIAGVEGSIRVIKIPINTAGTVQFSIGKFTGAAFNVRKLLPPFEVAAGLNTLLLDEPIRAGETLAISGGTCTVWNQFSAPAANVSYQVTATPNVTVIAGCFYSYQYFVAPPAAASTTVIRAKLNGTVGTDCEFSGNRAIQDAIESIRDNGPTNRYRIDVYPGVYQAVASADFNAGGVTQSGSTMVSFIQGKSYVSIRGTDKDRCIIRGELPDNLTSTVYQYYQTVYWQADQATLENVTVTGKNLRYPIHIDNGQLGNQDFAQKLRNVHVEHYGNFNNATAWPSCTPIGLGMSDGQVIEYEGVTTKSPTWGVYVHTNKEFTVGSVNKYTNCAFQSTASTKIAAKFQSLGSGRNDEISLNNCALEGGYIISADDVPYIPTALASQQFNHMDFKIRGSLNSPFVYDPNFKGLALKVVSATTGASSTVRFDTASSAFPLIVKDKDYASGTFTNKYGVTNDQGYAYRDGVTGLSGYAIGRLDIGDEAYGLSSNTYGKSLGHRLGNCSTTSKTLNIIVDGTTYPVVFNQNYIGTGSSSAPASFTNAQIVTAIQTALGSAATVSTYAVGNDYFPEFNNVVKHVTASELILRGMAVYDDGGLIRKALSTDLTVTGIALDDILPSGGGRILTKGYMRTVETNRFSTLQESYVAIVKGDQLGISATAGKISKSATTKFFTCFADGIVIFNL